MSLYLITAPAAEPIDSTEVKARLKIEVAAEDSQIDAWITVARGTVEKLTRRQLVTARWALKMRRFPCDYLEVPKPPLQTLSSITYIDTAGVSTVWDVAKYSVDQPTGDFARRGLIVPAFNESWPITRDQLNAVVVTFDAGFGDAAAVPEFYKHLVTLLVGHFVEHREAVANVERGRLTEVPLGVKELCGIARSWSRKRQPAVA